MGDSSDVTHLVFVGGGHAHVLVLDQLARDESIRQLKISVTLISIDKKTPYSGMLPGCVAQTYSTDEIFIDLASVCEWFNVKFIEDEVIKLDPEENLVYCRGRSEPISYDVVSIDVGSLSNIGNVEGVIQHAVCTRPITKLLDEIQKKEEQFAERQDDTFQVVVVGGGVAGIELARAFAVRFGHRNWKHETTLITPKDKLIEDRGWWASGRLQSVLNAKGTKIRFDCKCAAVTGSSITLETSNGQEEMDYDLLIWAAGASPPNLLKNTGLLLSDKGYIAVNCNLQSLSHNNVFAAGDCISISEYPSTPKAGVYAVREAPFLANNIIAYLVGNPLRKYVPQDGFLSLMLTDDKEAFSSYKGTAFNNWAVWTLKDNIDKRFMAKFDFRNQIPFISSFV